MFFVYYLALVIKLLLEFDNKKDFQSFDLRIGTADLLQMRQSLNNYIKLRKIFNVKKLLI